MATGHVRGCLVSRRRQTGVDDVPLVVAGRCRCHVSLPGTGGNCGSRLGPGRPTEAGRPSWTEFLGPAQSLHECLLESMTGPMRPAGRVAHGGGRRGRHRVRTRSGQVSASPVGILTSCGRRTAPAVRRTRRALTVAVPRGSMGPLSLVSPCGSRRRADRRHDSSLFLLCVTTPLLAGRGRDVSRGTRERVRAGRAGRCHSSTPSDSDDEEEPRAAWQRAGLSAVVAALRAPWFRVHVPRGTPRALVARPARPRGQEAGFRAQGSEGPSD